MPVISGSDKKSGIVSLPPKVQLNRFERNNIVTPTIPRTGDPDFTGVFFSPFNESSAILATKKSVVAGTNLRTGSQYLKNLVASPNLSPTLIVQSTSSIGAINSKTFVLNQTTQSLKPFNDSRIHLGSSSFYLTGTKVTTTSGFSSPLSAKTQIVIDLSAKEDRILTKKSPGWDATDPGGELFGQTITGFCYYNFDTGKWDQIGLTDPATGKSILFDYACEVTDLGSDSNQRYITSGTNNFPMQFKPPAGFSTEDTFLYPAEGTDVKCGLPTVISFAPFKTTYHATSSQTIKLSNYITEPLLLEKAVVEFPFTARHRYDSTDDAGGTQTRYWKADNYVFFIYRQQRMFFQPGLIDSQQDVSSSNRFLIASASLAIKCHKAMTTDGSQRTGYNIPNSPAAQYTIPYIVQAESGISAVTGTARMEMLAASCPTQDLGSSCVVPNSQERDGAGGADVTNIGRTYLRHFWPGGTTSLPFFQLSSGYTGKHGVSASYSTGHSGSANPAVNLVGTTFEQFNLSGSLQTTFSNLPIRTFDGRTLKPLGGDITSIGLLANVSQEQGVFTSEGSSAVPSPYLLFPEDELVFGIDAGMGQRLKPNLPNQPMDAIHPNIITCSFATIKAGPAKITLFGSMIRHNKEVLPITNQPLTTGELQETLISNTRVLDQFDIERSAVYSGSYLERKVAGTYGISKWDVEFADGLNAPRQVVASLSAKNFGTTGSFERFTKCISGFEISIDDKKRNYGIYRADRYGYSRDLLEPQFDTRFSKNISGDPGLSEPPIYISFWLDGFQTAPMNTHSQNLSPFATSSIIYVDNPASTMLNPAIGQDRPNIPDKYLDDEIEII